MDTILEQLEAPLGPAVTLSKLLSANEELLTKYATPKLVMKFSEMVQTLGPQRRFVDFFAAICIVQGRAVKPNQEMVLRLTWMDLKVRKSIYLQLRPLTTRGVSVPRGNSASSSSAKVLAKYGPVKLPSGALTDGTIDSSSPRPADFLGREIYNRPKGFSPVGITWAGTAAWNRGHPEALFWDLEHLGLKATKLRAEDDMGEKGEEIVRLEELCWCLDGPALCEAITGETWVSYKVHLEHDKALRKAFDLRVELATYFVGQLLLHAAMCSGRSYNCIDRLQRTFASYTTLVGMAYNPHLPQLVRAAVVDLILVLYLDRYPQLQSSGRPKLPEELWVYSMESSNKPRPRRKSSKNYTEVQHDGTPLVRPLKLSDETALPKFVLHPSHSLANDPDPFNSFPSHFKFFLLRNLGNQYMKSFNNGCVVHGHRKENVLASSMSSLIAALLSFGFQSSTSNFQELVPILVRTLDGRSDVERMSTSAQAVPFDPPHQRYVMTSESPAVTMLKVKMIKCLLDVCDIRANFRLGNLLATFQSLNKNKKTRGHLQDFAKLLKEGKSDSSSDSFVVSMYESFEDNFVKGDGAALMLDTLAGENVDTILIDALMYDDDDLFTHALLLLDKTYRQRGLLLEHLKATILLATPQLPVFGTVATMSAEVGYLIFLARSYSVWGVCGIVSGAFDTDKYRLMIKTLRRLMSFLVSKPSDLGTPSKLRKSSTLDPPADHMAFGILTRSDSIDKDPQDPPESSVSTPAINDVDEERSAPVEAGSDDNDERAVEKLHQDVARSLNLHVALIEGLKIDYNLSFHGSICSSEEKMQSRALLVESQRELVKVLRMFCSHNLQNQNIVWDQAASLLRKLVGPLETPKLPEEFNPERQEKLPPSLPGTNAEAVIIECLRNNEIVCTERLSRDWFEIFATLLNNDDDPSTSPLLEFFEITIQPCDTPIPRNQKCCTEVFMGDHFPNLKKCAMSIFGIGPLCKAPERITRLLNLCVCGDNIGCASILQSEKLTMDMALSMLCSKLDAMGEVNEVKTAVKNEEAIAKLKHASGVESVDYNAIPLDKAAHLIWQRMHSFLLGEGNVATDFFLEIDKDNSGTIDVSEFIATCTLIGITNLEPRRANAIMATVDKNADGILHYDEILPAIEEMNRKADSLAVKAHASNEVAKEGYTSALLMLTSWLMECLVVDPRLFQKRETWCVAGPVSQAVLGRLVKIATASQQLPRDLVATGIACCKISTTVIKGARSLGFTEMEQEYEYFLCGSSSSTLVKNAQNLLSMNMVKSDLHYEVEELLEVLDPVFVFNWKRRGLEKCPSLQEQESKMGDESFDGKREQPLDNGAVRSQTMPARPGDFSTEVSMQRGNGEEEYEDGERNKSIDNTSIPEMLAVFVDVVSQNPLIKRKLLARRFEFALVLESVTERTAKVDLERYPGAVPLDFGNVVDRMMRFVSDHNFDPIDVNVTRIYGVLLASLMRGRSNEDGSERHLSDLSAFEEAAYREKQNFLSSRRATQMTCSSIATHSPGGKVAEASIDLLGELLNDGNVNVQQAVYLTVCTDAEGKFLIHMRRRLDESEDAIQERHERTEFTFNSMDRRLKLRYEKTIGTLSFFRKLVEGHFIELQNFLRVQPNSSISINIVDAGLKLFTSMAENLQLLRRMEDVELDLLSVVLDMLAEFCFGPCHENQDELSKDEGFLNALDKVLQSGFHARNNKLLVLQVKSKAILAICAMIEGRIDRTVQERLMRVFEPAAFEIFHGYLTKTLQENDVEPTLIIPVSKISFQATVCAEAYDAMVHLEHVLRELSASSTAFKKTQAAQVKNRPPSDRAILDHVAEIEFFWNGRIEKITFPLPDEIYYLSEETKARFLDTCDLSTPEQRTKMLLNLAPSFVYEMVRVSSLANSYPFYTFIHKNLVSIKWTMYAIVVMLNLNVMMATHGTGKMKGYVSAADGALDPIYQLSLAITYVLGMLNLIGYCVIVWFLSLTEIPSTTQTIEEYTKKCLADPKCYKYTNLGAFKWWTLTLIFNVLFIVMHIANYPSKRAWGLYLLLIFGINFPWTLSCVRNYIVVPNSPQQRQFCIVFDVLVSRPFFRNHLVLMIFSIIGFQHSPFFGLMLFDIFNNSRVLSGILQSMTRPMEKLGLVFYILICTTVVYAQFGLEYFEDWFKFGSTPDKGCHSAVGCFWLILYQAVPARSISGVLRRINNSDDNYMARVLYDSVFLIWVSVLLFNVITALVVQSFNDLRVEEKARVDKFSNECFICGFRRHVYDEVGLQSNVNFDSHKNGDHEIWNYIYFYRYLEVKSSWLYSGAESYVASMLARKDFSFMPLRASRAIQNSMMKDT